MCFAEHYGYGVGGGSVDEKVFGDKKRALEPQVVTSGLWFS